MAKTLKSDNFSVSNGGNMNQNLEIRARVLSDLQYIHRLNHIQGQVELLWGQHKGPEWNIFHDSRHNKNVETALYTVIRHETSPSGYVSLSQEEWFRLLASAWLHEIGMIIGLFPGERELVEAKSEKNLESYYREVRQTHHLRTEQYIQNNYTLLKIEKSELEDILFICRWHRIGKKISGHDDRKSNIRVRLISAFLKIALSIHLDEKIVARSKYQDLLRASGMDWENQFHWFKSSWIKSITANPQDLKITFNYYEAPDRKHPLFGFSYKRIKEEIEGVLKSVQEILIRGRNTCFLDVVGIDAGVMPTKDLYELDLIRSNTRLEELSSASEAYYTVLNTIISFSEYDEPYSIIVSYIQAIEQLLIIRPCHNLIRNLMDEVIPVINQSIEADRKVEKIQTIVRDILNQQEEKKNRLSENAKPFLMDRGSILLFGYSVSVIDALRYLPEDVKLNTYIYIGECRGKSQFDDTNMILYNDGLAFAQKVIDIGYRHVHVIPDIATGNLMKRNLIQKVLFGANGIDIDDGSFGHTCGHLAIADIAKEYQVPVYVIADTAKFGKLQWEESLNRDINWLTNDPKWYIMARDVATINPREDQVESHKINILITEIGAFPPERIPSSIKKIEKKLQNPFETFFTKAGFNKVKSFETRYLGLFKDEEMMTAMAIILQDNDDTVFLSKSFEQHAQKLSKNSKIYIIYQDTKPTFKEMKTVLKKTHCEVIPVAANRILKSVRNLKVDSFVEELREIEDPFTIRSDPYFEVKAIKDDTWFYGRTSLMEKLPPLIAQGQDIGLFGLRKVGKTSLIHQIMDRFIKTPTAYIDCQAMSLEAKDYFLEILNQLTDSLKSKGIEAIPNIRLQVYSDNFREQLLKLFALWKKSENHEPFLLVLDEIDKFFDPGIIHSNSTNVPLEYVRLFKVLRGLYQAHDKCLTVLVVTYRPDVNRKNILWEGVENPMFESFREEFLGFLTREESTRMIIEIGQWKDIIWEESAADRVFELCGGHPLVTRIFASKATIQGKRKRIDMQQVNETEEEVINTFHKNKIGNHYWEAIWLVLKEEERTFLSILSSKGKVSSSMNSFPNAFEKAFSNLAKFGLISDEDGYLKITAKLFRIWVSQKG